MILALDLEPVQVLLGTGTLMLHKAFGGRQRSPYYGPTQVREWPQAARKSMLQQLLDWLGAFCSPNNQRGEGEHFTGSVSQLVSAFRVCRVQMDMSNLTPFLFSETC